MSLTDLFHNMRDRLQQRKAVPASEVLPRMRESSGRLPALRADAQTASVSDVTPFANEIPPPPQDFRKLFPAHYQALSSDLERRGESLANWELRDGRDLGVSERGHTVAFVLHKTGTSAVIQVELTLFKGKLASVRVR